MATIKQYTDMKQTIKFEKRTEQVLATSAPVSQNPVVLQLQAGIFNALSKHITEYDFALKLLEDVTTLIYMITDSFTVLGDERTINRTKIFFAISTFMRLRSHTSTLKTLHEIDVTKYATKLFSYCSKTSCAQQDNETFVLQSFESSLDTARFFLDKFDCVKTSDFYKKIYKLAMYAMSLSLFEKIGFTFSDMGYSIFEQEAIKRKYTLDSDFVHTLIDTFVFLCERGFQIMRTGNYECLFHSGPEYVQFFDDFSEIKRQSVLLTNPEAHGFTESTFRANLDDLIDKGENIRSHSSRMTPADKRLLNGMINDLLFIRCDLCSKRATREHRKAPFAVLIFGESDIGKSSIKSMLYHHYAKVKKLDSHDSFCYTRNPVANFWDGFTTSQWAVVLDDIAAINPNRAPNGDPSMMELIQIVNSVPFVPDQADLQNKGRTPLKCSLVIATTNVKNLNAHHYFSHASAVQRRLPFIITPTVKTTHAKPDGTLDTSKCVTPEGSYLDAWDWRVEKVITRKTTDSQKLASTELLLETTSVIKFLQWYSETIMAYDTMQTAVAESVKKMSEIEICHTCYAPLINCECKNLELVSTTLCLDCHNEVLDCTCHPAPTYDEFTRGADLLIKQSLPVEPVDDCFGIVNAFTKFLNKLLIRIIVWWITSIFHWLLCKFTPYLTVIAWFETIQSYILPRDIHRHQLRNMGEYVKAKIGYPRLIGTILVGLSSVAILAKFTTFFRAQGGGISSMIGGSPTPDPKERNNVWYKDTYQLSSFDLTPAICSSKGMSRAQFVKMVEHNVVHMIIHLPNSKCTTFKAICLSGQRYITNGHNIAIRDGVYRVTVVCGSNHTGINTNIMFTLSEKSLLRCTDSDHVLFNIPCLPPRKDIRPYLASGKLDIKTTGFLLTRLESGEVFQNEMTYIHRDDKVLVTDSTCSGVKWMAKSATKTIYGDCGSMLVGETVKGFIILGMHAAGTALTRSVMSLGLPRTLIDKLCPEDSSVVSEGIPKLSSGNSIRTLGPLHAKSVARYAETGTAEVYGSFVGYRPTHKTTVAISPMAKYLSNHDYKVKYGPPVMRGWEPWSIAAKDMLQPVTDIDPYVVDLCVSNFVSSMCSHVSDFSKVIILDNLTAVNGAPGVSYIDKLNRNTSAGNPWKKSKKLFLEPIEPQCGIDEPFCVTEEIENNIDEIIKKYRNGERAMPNFCAHLKDEPLPFKKIKAKKTRVFTGAPMDWTIVVRKYLLSTVRLIQNNRYTFEAAPGTVAQSLEWTEMYNYITKYGDHRIIAGDYKSFDKTMSPIFILGAFTILRKICEMSGNYTSQDLRVIDCIAQDTAFPLVDFNGDLIQFYGSNPSGHPLTVIINSLANSLYMRYVYYQLNPARSLDTFKSDVSLMTYGDDNIMSVNSNNNWYNHTSISLAFQQMGITYTMADKEAISVPYVHISETSFLKRSWIYDDAINGYMAPLDHESIEKMLMVWVASKSICPEEQIIAVITSAVREYFFYGKNIFHIKCTMLRDLVSSLELDDWMHDSVFPTWESLINDYENNSKHVTL